MPPELKNNENNKEELAKSLHKDSPLPQLRTYQGDIAKFIQTKDQSAVSIALKEKEAKEKKEKEKWLKKQKEEEEKKRKESEKRRTEQQKNSEKDKKRRQEEEDARKIREKEEAEKEAQQTEEERLRALEEEELKKQQEELNARAAEARALVEEEARQKLLATEEGRKAERERLEQEARETTRVETGNPAVDALARELEEQMAIQKAKEEEEEREKQEKVARLKEVIVQEAPAVRHSASSMITLVLSVFLLAGAIVVGGYAWLWRDIDTPIVEENYGPLIRPDDKSVVEASALTPSLLREQIAEAKKKTEEGKITEVRITDSANQRQAQMAEVMNKLNLNLPSALGRSLGQDYILGVYGEKTGGSLFLIFRETDYGIAFRDMLEWEKTLYGDFQPLMSNDDSNSGTAAFRDYIISNKDTRAVLAGANKVRLLYTFLDKNTILITETGTSLRGLLDAYATRNLVR